MNLRAGSEVAMENPDLGLILIAVTSAMACMFLDGPVRHLAGCGYEPIIVSSPGEQLDRMGREAGLRCAAIPMEREIAPLRDLLSIWRLLRLMRRVRPTITDVGTPKAGLLCGIAAVLSRVPCRLYTLHGLRLETTTGIKRVVLTWTERIACACAQRVICVSPSLRQRAVDLKLVPSHKAEVLGSGSYGGIDVQRFSPEIRDSAQGSYLAKTLGLATSSQVIGYVGRITRDKGIGDLMAAFSELRKRHSDLRLLIVGDLEHGDPIQPEIAEQMETDPGIVHVGFVRDVKPYYDLMDVFVLASHREGIGYSCLEAQACGIPVVTTKATGAIDSIIDGVTGFHVPVGDWKALACKLDQLLCDPELRVQMGKCGRERVVREFNQEVIGRARVDAYRRLAQARVNRRGSSRKQSVSNSRRIIDTSASKQ